MEIGNGKICPLKCMEIRKVGIIVIPRKLNAVIGDTQLHSVIQGNSASQVIHILWVREQHVFVGESALAKHTDGMNPHSRRERAVAARRFHANANRG
jgi:hypothetical protein